MKKTREDYVPFFSLAPFFFSRSSPTTESLEQVTSMVKCRKINAENVGSDLRNDSGTDSSDTALDK